MCIRCAGRTVSELGIHRELGVRNTFVRSADLDGMEKKYVDIYEKIGKSKLMQTTRERMGSGRRTCEPPP